MARILHLSDTHLSTPGTTSVHPELDAPRRLREVLTAATHFGPFDAVVITGDVSDDGSIDGAQAARDLVDDLAPVVLAIPGNHDTSTAVAQVFGPAGCRIGEWQVAGAATNVPNQVQGDARPLIEAIRRVTETAPDRPAVVLHHHPVQSRSTHEWFVLDHQDGLQDALDRRTAPLVLLSGHTHEAYDERVGQVHFIGAPSTYYGIIHDGDSWTESPGSTGAFVVELRDDGSSEVMRIHA